MSRSNKGELTSAARRHFFSAIASLAGKVTGAAALGSTVLSSSAEAHGRGFWHFLWSGGRGGPPKCFLRGTRILTPRGEARVEDLRIGDLIVTMRGEALPIKWIGRNSYLKTGLSGAKDIMPVRIARSAIGESVPHRDLYLSPRHGLFIDGFLIPAKDLINQRSIVSVMPPDLERIEYYQIVLSTHQVIWAEGVPVETFFGLAKAEYEAFDNFDEFQRLHPDGAYAMTPLAQNLGTGRAHLNALIGIGLSYFREVPDPLHAAYERMAVRAEQCGISI